MAFVELDNENFKKQLKKFSEDFIIRTDEELRFIAFTLYQKIRLKTPVDKGNLQGSFQISRGSPRITGSTNFVGQVALPLKPDPEMGPIFITSELPYAAIVEYGLFTEKPETPGTIGGYSKKAPQGMVRISMLEIVSGDFVVRS